MRYIDINCLVTEENIKRWGHSNNLWENKKLKKDFRDFFHNKCWYTEVRLVGQDVQIDHFRPKAAIKQFEKYNYNQPLQSIGYHWLKNEPSNYRASCVYSNRKTGNGGKGNFFPLADGSPYLTNGGNEKEEPLLLDPCKAQDVALISFSGNNVVAASTNATDKIKVDVSRTIYNLDDAYIKAERAKVWNNVERIMEAYQSGEMSKGCCVKELKDVSSRNAPFSACAIACINSLATDEIKSELDLTL